MLSFVRIVVPLILLFTVRLFCFSQENKTVQWQFKAHFVTRDEVMLVITATVHPGWHLYSQDIKEGGPMPTRFTFDQTTDFLLLGETQEKGKSFSYHDEAYEMEITWYSGTVTFSQKIKILRPSTFSGSVEYMTCNDHTCIPGKQKFSFANSLPREIQ
jgi:DsbC/DsbD-like thiol-disulfide interchange protein